MPVYIDKTCNGAYCEKSDEKTIIEFEYCLSWAVLTEGGNPRWKKYYKEY
jgi:hypothetical protein